MNELKKLAKEMVWVQDGLKKETLTELDREELNVERERITNTMLAKGYSASLLVQYMEEYRELGLGDYQAWINS